MPFTRRLCSVWRNQSTDVELIGIKQEARWITFHIDMKRMASPRQLFMALGFYQLCVFQMIRMLIVGSDAVRFRRVAITSMGRAAGSPWNRFGHHEKVNALFKWSENRYFMNEIWSVILSNGRQFVFWLSFHRRRPRCCCCMRHKSHWSIDSEIQSA